MSIEQESAGRAHWMGVLARARPEALEQYWASLMTPPIYRFLRRPEVGLALVRGRMGGSGDAFNLGEMTMVRCVIETDRGTRGFAYVAGRNRRHGELAAVFDALMQDAPEIHGPALIEPLQGAWEARRAEQSRKAAATQVNFMTLVRGS